MFEWLLPVALRHLKQDIRCPERVRLVKDRRCSQGTLNVPACGCQAHCFAHCQFPLDLWSVPTACQPWSHLQLTICSRWAEGTLYTNLAIQPALLIVPSMLVARHCVALVSSSWLPPSCSALTRALLNSEEAQAFSGMNLKGFSQLEVVEYELQVLNFS